MTQEEFYMWILSCDSNSDIDLPEFNSEFLKKYEIAKLVLNKFGINSLNEEKQRKLNLEAVSSWFRVSEYIRLKYDIPEILELLPERFVGHLGLSYSKVKSLPKLKSVGGMLDLSYSQVQSLPELESVGGWLGLQHSEIESLPNLESVGKDLRLYYSKVESFPKLESVGGTIFVTSNKLFYWNNYFKRTGRTDLFCEKV